MAFRRIAAVDEVWSGEMVCRELDGKKVLVLNLEDKVYAYENRCPHQGVELSLGTLENKTLTCSAHLWEYDVTTGCGINPAGARLKAYPVKVEENVIMVDLDPPVRREAPVGPVLEVGATGDAVLAAIRRLNRGTEVVNRGSYVRVLVPGRCIVTRDAVRAHLGHDFQLPGDLEKVMPSFRGRLLLGPEEAEMARMKTYWHLQKNRRKPTDYELGTSQLLYYRTRGFEANVPIGEWYKQYQDGSPFSCTDWEKFSDPRATTYTRYVEVQHDRETYVDGLLDAMQKPEYDGNLPARWLQIQEQILAPMRYPCHGLQMVAAYVGHMAPGGRITVVALMQAADEMRRIQRVAYRMRQLQGTRPGWGENSRAVWQDDPVWQPMRRVIESLLVTYDWGESLVALNLAVKPALDAALLVRLGRLAAQSGDPLLEQVLLSLYEDCAWHQEWTLDLVRTALADTPSNGPLIRSWLDHWTPLATAAAASLETAFGAAGPLPTDPFPATLDHLLKAAAGVEIA